MLPRAQKHLAEACGISVGNLTYYYPKKEDLLMLEHDCIMHAFIEKALTKEYVLDGIYGYFSVECAFLHYIVNDSALGRLYRDVINIPSLRRRYCQAHYELYCKFVSPVSRDAARLATAAMAGLEFELADEGLILDDAQPVLEKLLRSRLIFEGLEPAKYEDLIRRSAAKGIEISRSMPDSVKLL